MKKRNKRKQPTNHRKSSSPPETTKHRRLWQIGLALAGVASAVGVGVELRFTSTKQEPAT